jgi:hypothetical protein
LTGELAAPSSREVEAIGSHPRHPRRKRCPWTRCPN